MKKLIIFIGIVLFSGFASTSVHAKEVKLTQEEQIAKLKADYTAQADVVKKNESNLSLLKANKENSDKLTASNKKLTEAETELKKLETKLAETQKKAVTDSYKQDQKTKEVGDAETAVNTQKKSIETMKTERAKNPIKIAENKVADSKIKLHSIAGESALWTLAYETSSGFDVSKFLKASDNSQEGKITIVPGDGADQTDNIFYRIIKLMSQVVGTFAILMLIIGGYFMITSKGDESRLTKGKNIFTNTIIGVVIAFLSYMVVTAVISVLF